MSNFVRPFIRTVFKNTAGFLPTWPLGEQVKLGDIITIRHKKMDHLGHLSDLGIKVDEEIDPTSGSVNWQSKDSVKITTKAAGKTPVAGSNLPAINAGLTIEFTKDGGFLFEPRGIRYNRIKNLITVRDEARNKLSPGMFNCTKIYIVKEVAVVDSYALTISESGNSKLEVSAEGTRTLSVKDLSDANIKFNIETDHLLSFKEIGSTGGSIFYKAERLVLTPKSQGANVTSKTAQKMVPIDSKEVDIILNEMLS